MQFGGGDLEQFVRGDAGETVREHDTEGPMTLLLVLLRPALPAKRRRQFEAVYRRVDIGTGGSGTKPLWKVAGLLQCRTDEFVNIADLVTEYREYSAQHVGFRPEVGHL